MYIYIHINLGCRPNSGTCTWSAISKVDLSSILRQASPVGPTQSRTVCCTACTALLACVRCCPLACSTIGYILFEMGPVCMSSVAWSTQDMLMFLPGHSDVINTTLSPFMLFRCPGLGHILQLSFFDTFYLDTPLNLARPKVRFMG